MCHPGRLEGKTAIITGAGLGLGEGIARKFIEEGANLLLFEINAENGQRVAKAIPSDRALCFEGDVTDQAHWHEALKVVTDKFGGLNIVVNNAGVVHKSGPSIDVPQAEYDRVMHVNVLPPYHSAAAVQPYFAKQKRGVFVNISSISATRPRPNLVWYAGSKGAASAITKGFAAEFARNGMRCSAILPVAAETGMVASVLGGEDSEEGRAVLTKGIPLGRMATPRDVADAAAFLASDKASFITGIELPLDGGRALQ